MADSALARLDPLRRERLQALGYELLTLRAAPAPAVVAVSGAACPRLVVLGLGAGPRPLLLRALLAALGVREDEVSETPQPELPQLAFGAASQRGESLLPSLAALRDARAKRAAWPALRSLRRRLGSVGPVV